jgi:hypothetical protein
LSGPGEQFGVVGIGSLEICFQGGPFDLGTDCYVCACRIFVFC